MLALLENKQFIIGQFDKVIDALAKKLTKKENSQIILACSLHELAIKNEKSHAKFYQNIDYCTTDSMLITKYFQKKYQEKIDRVYGPDLMLAVFTKQQKNKTKITHYLLCPNLITKKKISNLLRKRYPNSLILADYLPKKINRQQELAQYQKIIDTKADFVWIGIGSPKQLEITNWLKDHSQGMKIFCVGAAFEFISGQKKQAPVWMQKNGLEWLFRLISEPKRLWKRYLVTVPKYLLRQLASAINKKIKNNAKKAKTTLS
ncbi:MAG: WecB/TagA/CpsF family glycosyltransferase [Candidatus Pacebacteria bacterium]|nr:WecB/TagA/CpsF family glycosyltransferase [Candidatus Paceibacterota bacterium]